MGLWNQGLRNAIPQARAIQAGWREDAPRLRNCLALRAIQAPSVLFFSHNLVLQNPLPSSTPSNPPSHSIRIDPAPNKSVQNPGEQHALSCLLTDVLEEACTGLFGDSAAGLVLAHRPCMLWKARVAVTSLPPWLEISVMRADQFQNGQYKFPSPFAQDLLTKDMSHH